MLTISKFKERMIQDAQDPQEIDWGSYSNDISIEEFISNEYPCFSYLLESQEEKANNMKALIEEEENKKDRANGYFHANKDNESIFSLFKGPSVIGIVSDGNQGKSNLIYWILEELSKKYNFRKYAYGLRCGIVGVVPVSSVEEIEQIRNSLIIIDEFSSLFDLENRKERNSIENTFRLLFHNNNIVILSGHGENFKKFISAKCSSVIFKKSTIADLINGSSIKNVLLNYKGMERGSTILNLKENEAIIFDGLHYTKIDIPYLSQYDTKAKNVPIFLPKNVSENAQKAFQKR